MNSDHRTRSFSTSLALNFLAFISSQIDLAKGSVTRPFYHFHSIQNNLIPRTSSKLGFQALLIIFWCLVVTRNSPFLIIFTFILLRFFKLIMFILLLLLLSLRDHNNLITVISNKLLHFNHFFLYFFYCNSSFLEILSESFAFSARRNWHWLLLFNFFYWVNSYRLLLIVGGYFLKQLPDRLDLKSRLLASMFLKLRRGSTRRQRG